MENAIEPIAVLIYVIAFLVAVVVTRAIFSIPKIVNHLRVQTILLAKIARTNGVDESEIQNTLDVLKRREGSHVYADYDDRTIDRAKLENGEDLKSK